jgi:transcriptional regulator with XRE-family HTH domain
LVGNFTKVKSNNINKEIGARIKLARINSNLSQDSIAEDLGISVSAYSNMERGAIDITIKRIMQVSEILKLNWIYFLGISANNNELSDKNMQSLNELKISSRLQKNKAPIDFEKEINFLKSEVSKLKKKINN